MRKAVTGIIAAAAGVAFSVAWWPGAAGDGAAPARAVPARAQAAAQTDRASADALAAAEAALWERLREQGRPDEFDAFLVLFPWSRFAAEARRRRDDLLAGVVRQDPRPEEEAGMRPPRRPEPALLNVSVAAAAAAVAPECGLIAAAADETSATLAGVLRRGQEHLVQGMLDAFGVPADAVRLRLEPFDGPYCDVLSVLLLNTITPRPDAPPRVSPLGARPLPEGEHLRFRVEMPEWPAHLSVFYLAVSGEAATLVSEPQPRPSGASVTLENPRWKIAAPFGTDMLLAVASEVPLFERRRPGVEKLEDFTPALAGALQRARRAGTRVTVRAAVVETAARP